MPHITALNFLPNHTNYTTRLTLGMEWDINKTLLNYTQGSN